MSDDLSQLRNKISELDAKLNTHTHNFDELNIKMGSKIQKRSHAEFGTGILGDLSVSEGGLLTYRKNVTGTMTTKLSTNDDGKVMTKGGLEVQAANGSVVASVNANGSGSFSGLITCTASVASVAAGTNGTLVTKEYVGSSIPMPPHQEIVFDVSNNAAPLLDTLVNGFIHVGMPTAASTYTLPAISNPEFGRIVTIVNLHNTNSIVVSADLLGENGSDLANHTINGNGMARFMSHGIKWRLIYGNPVA